MVHDFFFRFCYKTIFLWNQKYTATEGFPPFFIDSQEKMKFHCINIWEIQKSKSGRAGELRLVSSGHVGQASSGRVSQVRSGQVFFVRLDQLRSGRWGQARPEKVRSGQVRQLKSC